jgi:hypothetical protein
VVVRCSQEGAFKSAVSLILPMSYGIDRSPSLRMTRSSMPSAERTHPHAAGTVARARRPLRVPQYSSHDAVIGLQVGVLFTGAI